MLSRLLPIPEYTPQQQKHIQLYKKFTLLISGFSQIIFTFEDDPELLEQFADEVCILKSQWLHIC